MFLQELNPIVQEFAKEPLAFINGFVAGALRLNLDQDPLKGWLEKQGLSQLNSGNKTDNGNKPEYISIS
ncbi:hypothetical protein [Gloeocapsa sp. PCC 73106]|uniref:hypothetical protein n=1 Tax=Gloeocapsa sp. PCC 73106 TaxID=102232 RepID=UPI0002AC5535|nr:hypothetical protein [Gloeocapsa sp. PCC 73106]ELR99840.1 hypothetical protein GLO73106DRAFT_00036920 [Gloeocapsa sp. PCC 73106]